MTALRSCALLFLLGLAIVAKSLTAHAEPGTVEIPLSTYEQLLRAGGSGAGNPSSAFALGEASLQTRVEQNDEGATVHVTASLRAQVLREGVTMLPLLPSGTFLVSAKVDGSEVQLVASGNYIAWAAQRAGVHHISLVYQVDAIRSATGFSARIPTPPTASSKFEAVVPEADAQITVMPSAALKTTQVGSSTRVNATVPATSGIVLAWQSEQHGGHALSRAVYRGKLIGDAIEWKATFTAEVFGSNQAAIKILPSSLALKNVEVDGKTASILRQGNSFATHVSGKGRHTIVASFLVPVQRGSGPSSATLPIRQVPVSQFTLDLPGAKDVSTAPAAEVQSRSERGRTLAQVFLPMTTAVHFTWSEAIPEATEAKLRANAVVYHSALADVGVLHSRAIVDYQVTRGGTHAIEIDVPADAQINQVHGASEGLSDWRVTDTRGKAGVLTVFLNRNITGAFRFVVEYERLLTDKGENFEIPLLTVRKTHRQRGMVALLAGKELTMQPVGKEDGAAIRVGENQLPKFVRETLTKTIAHTFKYVGKVPSLAVKTAAPQRQQGRFDAQVDTLISLGDATMKAVARVEVDVKSGGIVELDLELPDNVNFLNLNAPSLRGSKVLTVDGARVVHVEFTQDMEGQFPVEVTYERIMKEGDTEIEVPTLKVKGTEVEQGRIAVEALAAMEVVATATEQLSPVETSQLPQQLVLQTTNPILMAFRYAYAEPAHRLSLRLTRHRAIATQAAVIDSAAYTTLFTDEGLMVTRAKFTVRNTSEQFLKVRLPAGSVVWKAFVADREEKPALVKGSEASGKGPEVLINIPNSMDAFMVDLVYKTPTSKLGMFGRIAATLPRPEVIATRTVWDVYLPEHLSYRSLSSNMELIERGQAVGLSEQVGVDDDELLRINVPTSGVRYRFQKVYANQGAQASAFSLVYMSGTAIVLEQLLAVLGMLILLLSGAVLWTIRHRVIWLGRKRIIRTSARVGLIVGGLLLVGTVAVLGTDPSNAILAGVAGGIAWSLRLAWLRRDGLMKLPTAILRKMKPLRPEPIAPRWVAEESQAQMPTNQGQSAENTGGPSGEVDSDKQMAPEPMLKPAPEGVAEDSEM